MNKKDIKIHIIVLHKNFVVFEKSFTKFPIRLGRSNTNEIPLSQYQWISRTHAYLEQIGDKLILKDTGSTNGLYVNGEKFESIIIDATKENIVDIRELQVIFSPYIDLDDSSEDDEEYEELTQITGTTDLSYIDNEEPQTPPPVDKSSFEKTDIQDSVAQNFKTLATGIQGLPKSQMNLEMTVIWKGKVYQSHLFQPGQQILVGTRPQSVYLPILSKEYHLADYDSHYVYCYPPKNCNGKYIAAGSSTSQSLRELKPSLPKKNGRHYLQINSRDICILSLTKDIEIALRYNRAPRQLTKGRSLIPEKLLKRTMTGSGIGHLLAVIIMFFLSPKQNDMNVQHLPPRVAKLLVQQPKPPEPKPKPKPEPEPEPEPEKKIVQKKEPPKKKIIKKVVKKRRTYKPKKIVVKKNPRMRRINNKVRRTPKRKKSVKNLEVFTALNRLVPNVNPINKPVLLNVNSKSSTSPKLNTKGIIGAIKAPGGRLPVSTSGGLKTQGKKHGVSKGYGIQGLRGKAGSRKVGGVVTTEPKLLKVKRSEGLNKKQVMSEVQRHIGKIQSCYERALLTSPGLSGRVEYEWYITPKGRVKWSKVKRSEIAKGDVLNNCVTKVFKKMKFPVAKNGESTIPSIGFPFGRL